jgi:tRNA pseudouridine55 synthase
LNPLDGILLVDKPLGLTSHDVVFKARKILGLKAVGHAGTLDPLATGLLILLLGEGTKLSDYLLNGDKSYEVRVKLGVRTDSMDLEGEVVETKSVVVSQAEVRAAALGMSGELELEVPVFSAVKVDGKKLYEMAHRGERPEKLPMRKMNFDDINIIAQGDEWIHLSFRCSKGSFVRAWADELGKRLGCGGVVETLRRSRSEPFSVENAITLPELEARLSKGDSRGDRFGDRVGVGDGVGAGEKAKPLSEVASRLAPSWVPLSQALPHFQDVRIAGQDVVLLKNGQISKGLQSDLIRLVNVGKPLPPVRVVDRETGNLMALLLAAPGEFYKIKRVFQAT